jgi:hypothetical protein
MLMFVLSSAFMSEHQRFSILSAARPVLRGIVGGRTA